MELGFWCYWCCVDDECAHGKTAHDEPAVLMLQGTSICRDCAQLGQERANDRRKLALMEQFFGKDSKSN